MADHQPGPEKKPLGITDVVLRDAHQSLFATRLRIEDMLPIAQELDEIGFWSLEVWGGATFDACIRFLGEDPWERLRRLRAAMPRTRLQMLFRGQNILGYRHYADDMVDRFVALSAENGIDVFRIFDAMNDVRNMSSAIRATLKMGKHAQAALSYTTSPAHSLQSWLDMAKRLEDLGSHSLCIKDMAGLITPFAAFELVSHLKETVSIPISMQSHATTGMSTTSILKAVEAGLDMADTSISSMSMTYGHSATESVVAIMQGTPWDTGLDLVKLEHIAAYFRTVRKKYARFEGSLKGVDSRILVAQLPGGMLSNLENQLKEQGALDRMDAVLKEIPQVRQDLGYIPLVTPTSQIVGTQAVLNVLVGRYKSITKETSAILKGEYGATPAPMNAELQQSVLCGQPPITCRPADLLEPEMDLIAKELDGLALQHGFTLSATHREEDQLSYALLPQPALHFFRNRGNPLAFEPPPDAAPPPVAPVAKTENTSFVPQMFHLRVNGLVYEVEVTSADGSGSAAGAGESPVLTEGDVISSALSGVAVEVLVEPGNTVAEGDVLLTMEAMKMLAEVRAPRAGTITGVLVEKGQAVSLGVTLFTLK